MNIPQISQQAGELFRDRKYEEARDLYTKILQKVTQNGREHALILYGRGLCNFKIENLAEAKKDFEEASSILPTEGLFHINRAITLLRLREMGSDLGYSPNVSFKKALEYGFFDYYYANRFCEHLAQKEPEEAINILNNTLRRKTKVEDCKLPKDLPHSYNLRGEIYYKKNDLSKAKIMFKKALEKDSTFIYALFNLGLTAFKENSPNEAIGYFKDIAENEPANLNAKMNLARLYENCNMLEQAKQQYEKLVKHDKGKENEFKQEALRLEQLISDYESKFEDFGKWVADKCEGLPLDRYLKNHPEKTLDYVMQTWEQGIPPIELRIAALGHDIGRAFGNRVLKQNYGLDEAGNPPEKAQWKAIYNKFEEWRKTYPKLDEFLKKRAFTGSGWEGLYKNRKRHKDVKNLLNIVYDIYKADHSQNSAIHVGRKLLEMKWPNSVIEKATFLVLKHEEGVKPDDPNPDYIRRMADQLKMCDGVSSNVDNLKDYYIVRGSLEATETKVLKNYNRTKNYIELDFVFEGIKFGFEFLMEEYKKQEKHIKAKEYADMIEKLKQKKLKVDSQKQKVKIERKKLLDSIDPSRVYFKYGDPDKARKFEPLPI